MVSSDGSGKRDAGEDPDRYTEPKLALTPAKKHREQEVQRVIKNLEDEMQRLVDILVSKTNH